MQDFFNMGGHGMYIWPAYAITAIVLLANVFISNSQFKNRLKKVAMLVKSKSKKDAQAQSGNVI